MPVIIFNGDATKEQAKGARLDNGVMQAYAVRRDKPTELHFLGGHRIDDAPSYNLTEGKIAPQYLIRGGRNVVVEKQLSSDYVKSITFNLMLPDVLISVTDELYNLQENCDLDLLFFPQNCVTGCDEFFWFGEDLIFGTKQIQNAIIGYDDNEAPINMMRTAKVSGQLQTYYGMRAGKLSDATNALYANLIVEDAQSCEGCDCPYQTLVRGGAGTALAEPDLEYSTDGGKTWAAIDTTAIPVDTVISDIKYLNGYLLVSYTDVIDAVGTSGGVAYALGVGTAMTLSTLDVASLGLQTMEVVGNKAYAFGTAGEMYLSCDSGLTFTKQLEVAALVTETFIDSAYDSVNDFIMLAATTAKIYYYNGNTVVDISTDVSPTAATDLTTVVVWRGQGVAFGGGDGKMYENWDFTGEGTGTWNVFDFGSAVGAAAGDGFGYRSLVGVTNTVVRRDVNTLQEWTTFDTLTGNVTKITEGKRLLDEGVNYFLVVTDTGETYIVAKCSLCLETCG